MEYRSLGNLANHISLLGFGCMRIPGKQIDGKWIWEEEKAIQLFRSAIEKGINYFDTAYSYSDYQNERILGDALADGYRDKVFLTTKLPHWECKGPEDFPRIFQEQLHRLRTDHLDLYLLHALNYDHWTKMKNWGAVAFLKTLKQEGRILHYGFSFHGSFEEFKKILDEEPSFEAVQLQYNYYDTEEQAGDRGLALCEERNIPVIIMEGLRGGNLARVPADVKAVFDKAEKKRTPAEWAFRFLADKKQVRVILSGMEDNNIMEENLRIFNNLPVNCLTGEEKEMMKEARKTYKARNKVGCTSCKYCTPCPSGVSISEIFSLWNHASIFDTMQDARKAYKQKIEKKQDASQCIGCGHCESVCPQSLRIIEELKKADFDLKKE